MSEAALRTAPDPKVLNLSLVSHTNVGKTTLARTLVRGDVGDVLDQAHVTEISTAYTLLQTEDGERLELWDTPGFGDSARLLRRLKREGSGLGRFLTQVWDRFSNRAMWCSQQAIRNVREQADVVLYVVNASEYPEDAGYVDLEMEILGWIGKPVLVLINQTGPVRPPEERREDLERWTRYADRYEFVRGVVELDAFSRSWVQEGILFERVGDVLPDERAALLRRLLGVWQDRSETVFTGSTHALAELVARAALDREVLEGSGADWLNTARKNAMKNLALRLEELLAEAVDTVIALHELEGEAAVDVKARIEDYVLPADEKQKWKTGALGGVVSGALTGLTTDFLSGGLTFGGGFVAGAILGFLGTAGATKGLSILKGEDQRKTATWSPEFLRELVVDAALRYLAVAHFGRGTGRFRERREPAFWRETLEKALEPEARRLERLFQKAEDSRPETREELAREIEPVLAGICRAALDAGISGTE